MPKRHVVLPVSVVLAAFVFAAVAVGACGGKKPPKEPNITETVADAGPEDAADAEPPKPKALVERLGGKEGISKVVDTFVKNVSVDNKINKRFAKLTGPKLDKFKANLVDQICFEASRELPTPACTYGGKSMKDAHKGMRISENEWNALVLDLKAALEENKVGQTEIDDLIAILAPMHDDIVDPKAKPAGGGAKGGGDKKEP